MPPLGSASDAILSCGATLSSLWTRSTPLSKHAGLIDPFGSNPCRPVAFSLQSNPNQALRSEAALERLRGVDAVRAVASGCQGPS